MDYIEVEALPADDIVVVNEEDFVDFGFVIDLDELHVLVVDPCGKLTFIVVPPWRQVLKLIVLIKLVLI